MSVLSPSALNQRIHLIRMGIPDSATMTTGALGGYFYGFLKSKIAGAFTLATGILYAFIYMLLQMESGGLLCGSLALFLILCVIMYFTRKQGMFEPKETIE